MSREIQIVRLEKGDVLLITYPKPSSLGFKKAVRNKFKKILPNEIEVISLDEDIDIKVLKVGDVNEG